LRSCIAEDHHAEFGLIWPLSGAPYPVHLVVLAGRGSAETLETAENLYTRLHASGIEALYDDRAESPGVKFNDADLIGLPVRLTVSERALKAGGVELKRRDQAEREIVPLDQLIPRLQAEIAILQAEIEQTVVVEDLVDN